VEVPRQEHAETIEKMEVGSQQQWIDGTGGSQPGEAKAYSLSRMQRQQ